MHSMKTDLVEKFCKHYGFQARFTKDHHNLIVLAIDTLVGGYRLGFENASDYIYEFTGDDKEAAASCFLENLLDPKKVPAMILIGGLDESEPLEDSKILAIYSKIRKPRSLEELEISLDLARSI